MSYEIVWAETYLSVHDNFITRMSNFYSKAFLDIAPPLYIIILKNLVMSIMNS